MKNDPNKQWGTIEGIESPIYIQNFTSSETLSKINQYEIVTDTKLDTSNLLAKKAYLSINGRYYHGIITKVKKEKRSNCIKVEIKPEIYNKLFVKKSMKYENCTIEELVNNHLCLDATIEISNKSIKNSYFQLNESDYNFFNIAIESNELIYYFDTTNYESKITIIDKIQPINKYLHICESDLLIGVKNISYDKNVITIKSLRIWSAGDSFINNNQIYMVINVNLKVSGNKIESYLIASNSIQIKSDHKSSPCEYNYNLISNNKEFSKNTEKSKYTQIDNKIYFNDNEEINSLININKKCIIDYMQYYCIYNPDNKSKLINSEENKIASYFHKTIFIDNRSQMRAILHSEGELYLKIISELTIYNDKNIVSNVVSNEIILSKKGIYKNYSKDIEFNVRKSNLKISSKSISLNAAKIEIVCESDSSEGGLSRITDLHLCPQFNLDGSPHLGGEILEGSDNIMINGLSAARIGDHATCHLSVDMLNKGASGLHLNGIPAACINDGTLHQGSISSASEDVLLFKHFNSNPTNDKNEEPISNENVYWAKIKII